MCKKAVTEIRSKQYTIENVRDAATLLHKEYDVQNAFPVVKMITDAGFKVYSQELKQGMGGYIIISNDLQEQFGTDKIIVVNESENTNRKRFSLAHEFGHYLLDPAARSSAEFYDAFETDDNKTELELLVDRFAAELLMPCDAFKTKYNEIKESITDQYERFKILADFFAVPSVAVQKRFEEVGISL